jgi:hypothetical protein
MRLDKIDKIGVRTAAGVGIAAILLMEAYEAALLMRRHAARAVDTWWAARDRREKRALRRHEIRVLARLAKPRS